jgi:uncharacterized membrane protein YgcG
MSHYVMKVGRPVLLVLALGPMLISCGNKQQYAQCVNQQNQIIDPAQCQQLQIQAAQHQNDQSWLQQYLLYHWVFGGSMNGMNYYGGYGSPLYQPLPAVYHPYPQTRYVTYVTHTTGRPPSTVKPPPASAFAKAQGAIRSSLSKTNPSPAPTPAAKSTAGSSAPKTSSSGSSSGTKSASSSSSSSSSRSSSSGSSSGSVRSGK